MVMLGNLMDAVVYSLQIRNQWLYHGTDDTQCRPNFNVGALMCNINLTVLATGSPTAT